MSMEKWVQCSDRNVEKLQRNKIYICEKELSNLEGKKEHLLWKELYNRNNKVREQDCIRNKYSLCSFSMMVKWANYGLLQAYDGKMLDNDGEMLIKDGEMLVNDGEMSIWWYTHFTIIDEHFTIISF